MRAPAFVAACLAALLAVPTVASRARAEDAPNPGKPEEKPDPSAERNKTRGYVCIQWGLAQRMSAEDRAAAGITVEKGLVVSAVTPDGPADRAGIQVGDVPITFFGEPIPDAKDLPTDDESFSKFMKEKTKPIADKIDPGMKVEMVIERQGKRMTFTMVAVDATKADALAQAALEEENAVKVPKPEGRGEARPLKLDFQTLPEGESRPAQFLEVTGYWEVTDDNEVKGNKVITQGVELLGDCIGLIVADGRVYGDASAQVRFLLMKGEKSASAALVLRAKDRRNYYMARVDGVAQTLSIVKMERGESKVLATASIKSPKLQTWFTLKASAVGKALSVTFGDKTVTAEDATFTAGWSGLATSLDAVTAFDDLELTPATK
ncbi:MAG: PDZ domain-containing protein [Planctomycetota bacterium]